MADPTTPQARIAQQILEQLPVGMFRADAEGAVTYCNPEVAAFSRIPLDQMLGHGWQGAIHPDDRSRVGEQWGSTVRTQRPLRIEFRTLAPGAPAIRWVLCEVRPVRDDAGEVVWWIGTVTDITREVELRERLDTTRTRLAEAQRLAQVGSWEWDIASGGLWWSDQVYRLFGMEVGAEAPTYSRFLAAVHPADRPTVEAAVGRALEEDTPYRIEHRVIHPDGSERLVVETGSVDRDAQGAPVRMVGTVQDITDQRARQEASRARERMEAIGRLAGGIAHDFNNMLMVMLGAGSFVAESLDIDDPRRDDMDLVMDAARRARTLTRHLLAFGRRQVLRPRPVDLSAFVRDFTTLARRAVDERVRVTLELDPELPPAFVDVGQMEQVLMNLVVNAGDAMPDGGQLTIRTFRRDTAGQELVCMAVSDTGVGIAEDALPLVFDPYFTTKPHGNGLGLATCEGIVSQSGGRIRAHSVPGGGTTMEVCLPVHVETTSPAPPADGPPPTRPRLDLTGARVLLVEDEATVRLVVGRALEESGLDVLVARSGEEALEWMLSASPPVSVVLTDVVMQGMSGPELARRLSLARPDVPVLYMSGYPREQLVAHGVSDAGSVLLHKPIEAAQLRAAIEDALAGSGWVAPA